MDNKEGQISYGANQARPIVCVNNDKGKIKYDINTKGKHSILRETRVLGFFLLPTNVSKIQAYSIVFLRNHFLFELRIRKVI